MRSEVLKSKVSSMSDPKDGKKHHSTSTAIENKLEQTLNKLKLEIKKIE